MGKNNMGFFYGKLYNSCNRTFSVGNGEKFIGGTGLAGKRAKLHREKSCAFLLQLTFRCYTFMSIAASEFARLVCS